MKSAILDAKTVTKIGRWNVQTLYQSGKLAQVFREFANYKIDILELSEMKWTGSGRLKSKNMTLLYSGHEQHHMRGVGITISNTAIKPLLGWTPVNDRIITARFQSKHAKTTIIQAYAPTGNSDEEEKNYFYAQLQDVFDQVPNHDVTILMGDMNAKLDGNRQSLEDIGTKWLIQ